MTAESYFLSRIYTAHFQINQEQVTPIRIQKQIEVSRNHAALDNESGFEIPKHLLARIARKNGTIPPDRVRTLRNSLKQIASRHLSINICDIPPNCITRGGRIKGRNLRRANRDSKPYELW